MYKSLVRIGHPQPDLVVEEIVAAPPRQTNATPHTNVRLNFRPDILALAHSHLCSCGFTEDTIREFGLGICSNGYLRGCIVIPLHDRVGQMIGWAGRNIHDDNSHCDRFIAYSDHKRITYRFRKTEFLYNANRIIEPVDDLVVVEGFSSVWWVHQNTIKNVVGLIGRTCSSTQADLIVSLTKPNGRVWLMPDRDKSSERCATSVLSRVSPYRFIRWIKLARGKQVTDYHGENLLIFLGI